MEATNISIKQQSSVSINVATRIATLKEIKQRVLSAVAKWSMVNGQWSITRLYRQELRLTRAVAAWCDRHSALVNWMMAILVMAFAFYVFLFV